MVLRSLLLLSLAWAAAAGGDDEPQRLKLLGKLKAIAEDGTGFTLAAKKGKWKVILPDARPILRYKTKPLRECTEGTELRVLGRRQEQELLSTGTYPAQVFQVKAIVTGKGFVPPQVPADLAQIGLKWHDGKLKKGRNQLWCGDSQLVVGRNHVVILVEQGMTTDLEKRQRVYVSGRVTDRKARELTADEVVIISPRVPGAQYRLILGGERKSAKKKSTSRKRGDFRSAAPRAMKH